jgi:hypothetical protein
MTCKYCNSRNKTLRVIAWTVYLAPLAYSAYAFLKDVGAFEKAKPYVESAVESARETAQDAYETVKDAAADVYTKVANTKDVGNAAEVVEKIADDIADGNT